MQLTTAWSWTDVCATGIHPWLPLDGDRNRTVNHQQLAPCFQQLFMQVPVFVLFALLSAYQFGVIGGSRVQRDRVQRLALRLRCSVVLLLVALTAMRAYYWTLPAGEDVRPWPADVLVTGVETIAYVAHLAYLLALIRRGSSNHRGPLAMRVCWITVFMLAVIRTTTATERSVANWLAVLLHGLYLVTLVPMGEAERVASAEPERNDVRYIIYIGYLLLHF